MAYSAITNAEIDQDSPITQTLMTKYRDNVIFNAEGIWHPYDRTEPDGSEDGIFYDFATDGAVASVETPDFAAGYDYMVVFEALSRATIAGALQVEVYKDTDAAYEAAVSTSANVVPNGSGMSGYIWMQNPKGWSRNLALWEYALSGAVVEAAAQQVDDSTAQTYSKMRLSCTGNIDGGRIALFRRKIIWGL